MRDFIYSLMSDQRQGILYWPLKVFLRLLSFIYGILWGITYLCSRLRLLKVFSISRPVISIGNLTLGGTGKTPLAAFIARYLKKEGKHPAILMRGYMSDRKNTSFSDEAEMLKEDLQGVPIGINRNRLKASSDLLNKQSIGIFILDDGFQHLKIKRDLDIVVIDATNPYGNGFLIPRGILREPVQGLKRSHCVVLTKTDQAKESIEHLCADIRLLAPQVDIFRSVHVVDSLVRLSDGSRQGLDSIRGKRVCAVSSIGAPEGFKYLLKDNKVEIIKFFEFKDHHWYTQGDLKGIDDFCLANDIHLLLTTHKDAVKIKNFMHILNGQLECLVLKIRLELTERQDEFFHRISRLF